MGDTHAVVPLVGHVYDAFRPVVDYLEGAEAETRVEEQMFD